MKIEIKLILRGNDGLREKFQKSIKENPTLTMDLARSCGQNLMLALRLHLEDEICISEFKMSELNESEE